MNEYINNEARRIEREQIQKTTLALSVKEAVVDKAGPGFCSTVVEHNGEHYDDASYIQNAIEREILQTLSIHQIGHIPT